MIVVQLSDSLPEDKRKQYQKQLSEDAGQPVLLLDSTVKYICEAGLGTPVNPKHGLFRKYANAVNAATKAVQITPAPDQAVQYPKLKESLQSAFEAGRVTVMRAEADRVISAVDAAHNVSIKYFIDELEKVEIAIGQEKDDQIKLLLAKAKEVLASRTQKRAK